LSRICPVVFCISSNQDILKIDHTLNCLNPEIINHWNKSVHISRSWSGSSISFGGISSLGCCLQATSAVSGLE
jgi:hypothetical protein